MDRASERVQAGALLGAAVLAVGLVLPPSAARALSPAEGVGLFAPGLGCGPAETLVGTHDLLARVRSYASAAAAPKRRAVAAKARDARRPPTPAAPRSGAKAAPRSVELEPRAAVLRSFYSCNAAPNLAEGTGWRLVGPLRRG